MKSVFTTIRSLILINVFASCLLLTSRADNNASPGENLSYDTLKIFCSEGLNELVNIWTEEYSSLNPGFRFIASAPVEVNQMPPNSLFFITEGGAGMDYQDEGLRLVIGQSALVAVFNAQNPSAEAIMQQGITSEEISGLFSSKTRWVDIINGGHDADIKLFITGNKESEMLLKSFCRNDITDKPGGEAKKIADVIHAIGCDRDAIGFCMLQDIKKAGITANTGNIKLLPLDKNSNGRIDSFEDIYSDTESLTRGIWIGKYPKSLCRNICAIVPERYDDKSIDAFLLWIMNDGGKYLTVSGFSDLSRYARESNISILAGAKAGSVSSNEPSRSGLWAFLISLVALTGILLILIFGAKRKIRKITPSGVATNALPFNEQTVSVLKGIYFDKSHTWSFMEKDGKVRIGIDDFLQHVTGTLTKIKFREPGENVRRGEKIFTLIRNGKQIDIHSPVSGIIREKNISLGEDSAMINRSPFGDGWIYIIEPVNWEREIRFMFMSEKYKEWIKDEIVRLKEFLAAVLTPGRLAYSPLILQDGGELTDNVLADLEPEIWEDFQRNFIDKSV
ncbi:MAG: hypothetical protein GYA41_12160 [Bacteroidales bacterium]|nr:hypothetical protein [Bacteroidales bacterium]